MTREELVVAVILGLLVNEATDMCPWLAIRLVRWAAGLRYRHAPERAAARSEELAALVNDRPGRLLKLFTALGFALHALIVSEGNRKLMSGTRAFGAWLGTHPHGTGVVSSLIFLAGTIPAGILNGVAILRGSNFLTGLSWVIAIGACATAVVFFRRRARIAGSPVKR